MFHKCFEDQNFSYENCQLDWSSLNIPSNLFKVQLTEKNGNASSADTEDDEEIDEDEAETNDIMEVSNIKEATTPQETSEAEDKKMSVSKVHFNILR